VRTVLKQLVRCAVAPSPIKRSVSLAELERGQTMLQRIMVTTRADDAVGIKPVKGSTRYSLKISGRMSMTKAGLACVYCV